MLVIAGVKVFVPGGKVSVAVGVMVKVEVNVCV